MEPKKIMVCGGCGAEIPWMYPHSTVLCGPTKKHQPIITKMNWGNHG